MEIPMGALANLRILHLNDNKIGDAGLTALAGASRGLAKLEQLSLMNNNIGDADMASLYEAISKGALPILDESYKKWIEERGKGR